MVHSPLTQYLRIAKALIVLLCLARSRIFALPAPPPSLDLDPDELYQPSNLSLPGRPPTQPACNKTLGYLDYEDCTKAINLLPHDPRGKPVLRNFYTRPSDVSTTIPNEQVPLEKTYGGCTAQVLLATNFVDVPYDRTSWINLIGPLRILMRDCARTQGTGGVLTRNGNHGNLEVVLFNQNSAYGKVTIIRHSSDPVAVSIATQELLELLHLAPNIYDEQVELLLANQTGAKNVTSSQPSAAINVA